MPISSNGYMQWVEQTSSEIASESANTHYAEAHLVPYIAMGRANLWDYPSKVQAKLKQELSQMQTMCIQRIADPSTPDRFHWECKQLLIDGILSEEGLPHF
jgi:hypothetical protein